MEDNECCIKPPPFRGSLEDYTAMRKRQRLFLLQALRIATRFSQNPVTPEMLIASLPWLEREQYDHLADERNAFGNCGYPLCSQPRGEPPVQQYRILYKQRRVYDLTNRKRFCSDWCYTAFNHIHDQISCEPSWCRTVSHSPREVSLLSKEIDPEPGDLVLNPMAELRLHDSDDQSESDHSSDCDVTPPRSSTSKSGRYNVANKRAPHKLTTETCWGGAHVEIPSHNLVLERKEKSAPCMPDTNCAHPDAIDDVDAIVRTDRSLDNAAAYLKQWLTYESIKLLTSSTEEADTSHNQILPPFTMETSVSNRMTRNEISSNVLPLIDSVSVNAMRRQILMEVLSPSIHKILSHLDLPRRTVIRRMEDAIGAFRLSNRNIHMPRDESVLLALALLCVMAVSDRQLVALNDDMHLLGIVRKMSTGKDISISEFRTHCVIPFTSQLDFDALD